MPRRGEVASLGFHEFRSGYVVLVVPELAAGFDCDSLEAGVDSVAGFDSVDGLASAAGADPLSDVVLLSLLDDGLDA